MSYNINKEKLKDKAQQAISLAEEMIIAEKHLMQADIPGAKVENLINLAAGLSVVEKQCGLVSGNTADNTEQAYLDLERYVYQLLLDMSHNLDIMEVALFSGHKYHGVMRTYLNEVSSIKTSQ